VARVVQHATAHRHLLVVVGCRCRGWVGWGVNDEGGGLSVCVLVCVCVCAEGREWGVCVCVPMNGWEGVYGCDGFYLHINSERTRKSYTYISRKRRQKPYTHATQHTRAQRQARTKNRTFRTVATSARNKQHRYIYIYIYI
jgi:hypothetical protein